MTETQVIPLTTGRRKEAVARVRLLPGQGEIVVNDRPIDNYFTRDALKIILRGPLIATKMENKYKVIANVHGGGNTGQAGAIRLGIARALIEIDPSLRPALKKGGFLTRDPRAKERKKYGQRGARRRFQFSKR